MSTVPHPIVQKEADSFLAAGVDWSKELALDCVGAPRSEFDRVQVIDAEAAWWPPAKQRPALVLFSAGTNDRVGFKIQIKEMRDARRQEAALVPLGHKMIAARNVGHSGSLARI